MAYITRSKLGNTCAGFGMNDHISPELAQYIADYINEEISRGNEVDKYIIMGAYVAFIGGAADE